MSAYSSEWFRKIATDSYKIISGNITDSYKYNTTFVSNSAMYS